MKKFLALILACTMVFALALTGCGGESSNASNTPADNSSANTPANNGSAAPSDSDEVYNIRIATWDSAAIPSGVTLQAAIDKMNELGGGRINAEGYYAETLLSSVDSLSGTAQGLADITYWQIDMVAGTTPLASMLTLPFTQNMPRSTGLTAAIRELVLPDDSPFQKEMEAMNLHWVDIKDTDGLSIHLVKDKPVYALNDLQGIKLIGVAEMQDYLALGGGNIVNMAATDFYTSLEKGVVDGSLHHMALVKIFAENELTKSHTLYGESEGLHVCSIGFVANNEFWNSLPDDIKQIVSECLAGQQDAMIQADIDMVEELVVDLEETNQPIYEVDGDQLESWYEAGDQIVNKWLDTHENDFDCNVRELYQQYMDLCSQHMGE